LNVKRRQRLPRSRNVRPTRAIFAEDDSDETVIAVLTPGDQALPPLVEVSLKLGTTKEEIRMVKPPSVDELWSWYEMTGNMDADPSWAKNWETAMSFATAIAERSNTDVPNLKSKRVLEVGSGLGLVGIAAAKCAGADSVIFSDREPLAIHCALSSAAVSGMSIVPVPDLSLKRDGAGACAGCLFDWSEPQALAAEIDVVLGADCLYDPATAALLAKCCADLVAKTKGVVCIAEPEKERAIGCRAAFLDACTAAGATTRIVPLPKASSIHPPTVLVVASWE
jgi:predicted nicotinamide N-methyase